jgi:hypothetical protein
MRKLHFWGWLLFLPFFAASPVSAETPQPTTDPLLMTPDFTGLHVSLANYFWDPDGILGQFHMAYILGNSLMLFSVFLVRISTWLLNLGYMPSQWLTPIQQIADAIQQNQLIKRIWPILPVIAAAVLFKDFFKHQYQRAVQRAILFGLVLLALVFFQGLGTAKYLSATTEAIDAVSYGVSGWILGASHSDSGLSGDKAFEQKNNDVNKEVWQRLVDDPWEMGEIGTPGTTINADDLEKVKSEMSDGNVVSFILKSLGLSTTWGQSLKAGTTWKEVILRFPMGSSPRSGIAGILNSDDHPASKSAFNPYYRALLGLIMTLSALGVSAYNLVMGFLLLGAHVLFIIAITAGIVVLPCCLIPWSYSERMMQWWMKALTGSIFIKIALSAYVGATFLAIEIFRPAAATQSTGHSLLYMLLYPIWFVAALWILFRIQKKWRPLQRMTGVNLPGVNRFLPSLSQPGANGSSARNTTAAQRKNPEQLRDEQPVQTNETETTSQPVEGPGETTEAAVQRNRAAAPRTNPERAGISDTTVQDSGNVERRRETPSTVANRTQTAAPPTQERNRSSALRHEGTGPTHPLATGSTGNTENEATISGQERTSPRRQQRTPDGVLEEERGTNPIPADPELGSSQSTPREPHPQESMVSSFPSVEEETPNLRENEGESTGEDDGGWNQAENDSAYKIYDYRSSRQEERDRHSNPPTELADKPSPSSQRDNLSSEGNRVNRPSAEKIEQESALRVGDPDQSQTSRETIPQAGIQSVPQPEGLKEQIEKDPGPSLRRRSIPLPDVEPDQQIKKQDSIPLSTSTEPVSNGSSEAPPIPSRKEKGEQREPVPTESDLNKKGSTAKPAGPLNQRRESRRKIKIPSNGETAAPKIKSDPFHL